jgi:hypothetical protein
MLVDPSLPGVNAAMAELPCTLPMVEDIFRNIVKGQVLGKRDLLNGFFHCVLSPDARRYMGFTHPISGQLCRWIVLPQGTRQSPALFCDVSNAAARIFQRVFDSHGVSCKVHVYVDDFVLVANTHKDMQQAFALMDEEAKQLGLVFNPKKDVGRDTPLLQMEALGLTINADALTLSLPNEKRNLYAASLVEFATKYKHAHAAPRRAVEQLVGKLIFASRVCRWGFLFVQELLDQLHPVGVYPPPRLVSLTQGVWHDLRFWESVLGAEDQVWLGLRQHMVGRKEALVDKSKFTVEMFTDASGSWGVGGVLGEETLSRRWSVDRSGTHIGVLELEAVHQCLEHWKHDLQGQVVLVRSDNIQVVVAINKGASRKLELRETLLQIAHLGIKHGFELKARHVKGVDNPADAPSRGKAQSVNYDYTFRFFQDFNQPLHTVDCCAASSGYNAQPGCTTHFSAANPVQNNVPRLVGQKLWANIPFPHINSILAAIVAAWRLDTINTMATCVVPEWPTAAWYRKYLRRSKPLFRVLARYKAGSKLFLTRNRTEMAPPTRYPMLVIRIGQE